MQRKLLILILTLLFILPANAFEMGFFSRPNVNLDKPQKESPIEDYELPDMLIPEPESPKEAKKREKNEQKALKHKKKKVKKPKFKQSKKVEKHSFREVNSQNKAPKTFEQYLEMSKDIKREDKKIPRPSFTKDDKLVDLPDPHVKIVKYNTPPGTKDLDLRLLMTRRELVTQGVLSPDKSKMVYSTVYSYPTSEQVASEIFVINIPSGTSTLSALRDFHTMETERKPLIKAGTEKLFQCEKRTLVPLDWSEDSQKIAVKEKIGSQTQGPWKTQLWVYDFETAKAYELTAIREAIRYYWKSKNLDLVDYMWDIFPIGWDLYNKDRIVVYAYVYGKNHNGAKFLGTWSIDYKNQRSELMSETATDFEVSINGYQLEFSKE